MEENIFHSRVEATALHQQVARIKQEIAKVIVGQDAMIEQLLVAILADEIGRAHV